MNDLSHNLLVSKWDWEFKIEVCIKHSFPGRKVKLRSTTLYAVTLPQKQIAVVSAFRRSKNDKEYQEIGLCDQTFEDLQLQNIIQHVGSYTGVIKLLVLRDYLIS